MRAEIVLEPCIDYRIIILLQSSQEWATGLIIIVLDLIIFLLVANGLLGTYVQASPAIL